MKTVGERRGWLRPQTWGMLTCAAVALQVGIAVVGSPVAEAAPSGKKNPGAKGGKPGKHKHGKVPAPPQGGGWAPAPVVTPDVPATRALTPWPVVVERLTLENGLRVVLAPDKKSPTVAVTLAYDIGSRVEERGRGGFVQILSQLMLQGSANAPKGEHARLITSRGGSFSSEVLSDAMVFTSVVPSRELPLVLWLEVDRMKSLTWSQDSFDIEKTLALDFTKGWISSGPKVTSDTKLRELVFQAYWPYEHTPQGNPHDIENATLDALRDLHELYCAPNNAVLAITGDFDADRATQLVKRFFDTARRREKIPAFVTASPPEQTSQRASVIEDNRALWASFAFGWSIPSAQSEEHTSLRAAVEILAGGAGSRLSQKLISEKGLAGEVSSRFGRFRGPDIVSLSASLIDPQKRAEAEKVVDAEIESLAKVGPTDAEMVRVRNALESETLRQIESPSTRAHWLALAEMSSGDASLLKTEYERIGLLTKEKIRAAAAHYLTAARRSLVEIIPPAGVTPQKNSAATPNAPALPKPTGAVPMAPQGGGVGAPKSYQTPPLSHPLNHGQPSKPPKPKKK